LSTTKRRRATEDLLHPPERDPGLREGALLLRRERVILWKKQRKSENPPLLEKPKNTRVRLPNLREMVLVALVAMTELM